MIIIMTPRRILGWGETWKSSWHVSFLAPSLGRDDQWTIERVMMIIMTPRRVLGDMEIIVACFRLLPLAYQDMMTSGQ